MASGTQIPTGMFGGMGGTSFKPDPNLTRIQKGFDSGQITSSERAVLDRMSSRDQAFEAKLQDGGLSTFESLQVSARRKRYELTIGLFEKTNLPISAESDDLAQATRRYDAMKSSKGRNDLALGVQNGAIDKSEFQSLHQYSQMTETQRAKMAAGGYTADERQTIDARQAKYGEMMKMFGETTGNSVAQASQPNSELYDKIASTPKSQNQSSGGGMFGGLGALAGSGGSHFPNHNQGVAELNSSSVEAYGKGVVERPGEIFADERVAVRTHYRAENGIDTSSPLFGAQQPASVGEAKEAPPQKFENLNAFHSRLQTIDSDGDGQVTKRDVTNAMRNPEIKGDDAKLLASMHVGFDNFTSLSSTGSPFGVATRGPRSEKVIQVGEFADSQAGEQDYQNRTQTLNNVYNFVESRDHKLASKGLFGESGKPDPTSIKQGLEGDCWFLSTVSGMNSESLKNMVSQREDGSYNVNFPGKPTEVVSAPTQAEKLVYAEANGDWIQVLEKGADQVMERRGSDITGDQNTTAYELLTGKSGRHVVTNASLSPDGYTGPSTVEQDPGKLGDQLQTSFSEGRIVNAYSSQGGSDLYQSRLSSGNHAYTVMGYDAKTQTVTVRNPWGQNELADRDGKDDGIFQMPLKEFHVNFPVVSLSEGTPNAN